MIVRPRHLDHAIPGIELKKYIVKKERKEQRRYNFY
jgi:hypothetical protein